MLQARRPPPATRPKQQQRHRTPSAQVAHLHRRPKKQTSGARDEEKRHVAAARVVPLATAILVASASCPATAWAQRVCLDVPTWAVQPLTALAENPSSLLWSLAKSPQGFGLALAAAAAVVVRVLGFARFSLKLIFAALALWVAVTHRQAALGFAVGHPLVAGVVAVGVVGGVRGLLAALVLVGVASAAGIADLPSLLGIGS